MNTEICHYLQIKMDTVVKRVDCMVIRIGDTAKISKGKKGVHSGSDINEKIGAPKFFSNYVLTTMVLQLEDHLKMPFIDETDYDGLINPQLPANLHDEAAFKKAMLNQGFRLIKEKRNITFLVISDNSARPPGPDNL